MVEGWHPGFVGRGDLAVDDAACAPEADNRGDDVRVTVRQVNPVACDQSHAVSATMRQEAITIDLDLMQPPAEGRRLASFGGETGLDEA